jgi:hypothetical protein
MKKKVLLEVHNWDVILNPIITQLDGEPLNVHKLMAKHPKLLKAWWNFRNYAVNGGDLGRRKGELVILRVASYLNSWYEWASHVDRSLKCGLSLEEITRVNNTLNENDWETSEFLLLKCVDELIGTQNLKKDSYKKLNYFFTDKQIMDVIAIHGMYIILGCMLNIWGVELEEIIAKRLPSAVNKKKFLER